MKRYPLTALAAAVGVLLLAFALDQGSASSRDAALVVGSVALYVLIPASVIWFVVAAVLSRRSSRRLSDRLSHRLSDRS